MELYGPLGTIGWVLWLGPKNVVILVHLSMAVWFAAVYMTTGRDGLVMCLTMGFGRMDGNGLVVPFARFAPTTPLLQDTHTTIIQKI